MKWQLGLDRRGWVAAATHKHTAFFFLLRGSAADPGWKTLRETALILWWTNHIASFCVGKAMFSSKIHIYWLSHATVSYVLRVKWKKKVFNLLLQWSYLRLCCSQSLAKKFSWKPTTSTLICKKRYAFSSSHELMRIVPGKFFFCPRVLICKGK